MSEMVYRILVHVLAFLLGYFIGWRAGAFRFIKEVPEQKDDYPDFHDTV